MRRFVQIVGLAQFVQIVACGQPPKTQPPAEKTLVDISGRAAIHPAAAASLQTRALLVPSLAGATIAALDPVRALNGLPPLESGTIATDATFSLAQVDVTSVHLGVVAEINDAPGGPSPSVLLDSGTGIVRGKPGAAVTGASAWAVPRNFSEQLVEHATGQSKGALETMGYVLGMVRDASQNPLAGAVVVSASVTPFTPLDACAASPAPPCVWYPNAGGTATQTTTSASGLFVLPAPGQPSEYSAQLAGHSFPHKLAGSRAGSVLVLMIDEGGTD